MRQASPRERHRKRDYRSNERNNPRGHDMTESRTGQSSMKSDSRSRERKRRGGTEEIRGRQQQRHPPSRRLQNKLDGSQIFADLCSNFLVAWHRLFPDSIGSSFQKQHCILFSCGTATNDDRGRRDRVVSAEDSHHLRECQEREKRGVRREGLKQNETSCPSRMPPEL
jgi:hypothetical protein